MKDSFRIFCKQVLSCEELVDLWTEIQNYKSIKENESELKVKTAHRIWDKYFVAGSIEVPEELHSRLEDRLDSGEETLYDEVQTLVEDDLKEEAYHRFIKDFIKHANSSFNPLSSLNNAHCCDEISKVVHPINDTSNIRRTSSQQDQTPTKMNSPTTPNCIRTISLTSSPTSNHGGQTPNLAECIHNESPPLEFTPPFISIRKGIRIERLGDKIQVYGRSPTNSIKTEDKASNLEEYKYKGPLLPPNQEIRATVADIDHSFVRSKGEKEQFTQVACCEVSVNLLYQKIPIITQGSIEGMAEMSKKLYNLKDYLQTDNDSFVMDINSILTRCDRYSAHLQVENVESINNSSIIQMFKSSEKKSICCILKAQVVDQEKKSFNDYLVVFYDGHESYCLFHNYEKLFPKKGLRACVTYFENLDVMERFFNDFLAHNEHSASKLSSNKKYILKQLVTLRKKENDLIKKFLNYRVSLHIEDSSIINIEKKIFLMEDEHRNRIEFLLQKLKDVEDKIKSGQEPVSNQSPSQTNSEELLNSTENLQVPQCLSDDVLEEEDCRPPSPRKTLNQGCNKNDMEINQKPHKDNSDVITEYFINRLSSIESEMNEVKNAYTKKIESVVEKLHIDEERKTNPDTQLIHEMRRDIEMMKMARLQIEKDEKIREERKMTEHFSTPAKESVGHQSNEDSTVQETENYEHIPKAMKDLKTELANLKNEISILSTKKNNTIHVGPNEQSSIGQESVKTHESQLEEIVERINNFENYTYENMSNVKQAISEEKNERFNLFDALHVKLQSIEDKQKDGSKETKELLEKLNDIRYELNVAKMTSSLGSNSESTDKNLDNVNMVYPSLSHSNPNRMDSNQIINSLKNEIVQQVNQQIQQVTNEVTNIQVENVLQEYKKHVDVLEKKIEEKYDTPFVNNRNEEIDILERRLSLLENEMKEQMEKTVDSKFEQINFVNQNLNQVVNIKVESLEEKVEHLKEFIHMKTREMELSSLNILSSKSSGSNEAIENSKIHLGNDILLSNFVSQLSNMQHIQSNYDEKLNLITKLYDSSWNKTLELSEQLKDISVVRNNIELLKQNTDNKVGQIQSSIKRIDNQIEYITRRIQQVDQQKDEQNTEKMTLFINSLSSKVDQEMRKMNQYFERKELELNEKFLQVLTRERDLTMKEQHLEEREDYFVKHSNKYLVNNKEPKDNLLLKQVQHHLNGPHTDYSLKSVLYPLSSVDPDIVNKPHIADQPERVADEFKDSFLLKSPESLFSTSLTIPNYSLPSSSSPNYFSILNSNEATSTVNSNSTSPTNSTSSYHHSMVTSSGMQTFDDELFKLGSNNSPSTDHNDSNATVSKRSRRSSGSQTYKTLFKEYKKEDNSIIRSPFRKYAEQKDSSIYF